MIVDLLMAPLIALWNLVVGPLPDVSLTPPGESGLLTWLGRVDSFLPIAPVLQLAVAMLPFLGAFIAIRFALIIWKALPFT